MLAASLAVPPIGLAIVVAKKAKPDPWSLSALKPLLALALGHLVPDLEPLVFAHVVTQGGYWINYAPLVYYLFKLAWWAGPQAIAVGGSVAAAAFLYEALALWRGPKEAALLTLLWPTAAFQYFSHQAFAFAAIWTAWRAWEDGKRRLWLGYAALAFAFHTIMGPLAAAPLLRTRRFQALAALWAAAIAIRGAWPASDVIAGAERLASISPATLAAKAWALLDTPATLIALPVYAYILVTARMGGVYYVVALLGLVAAAAAAVAVPPGAARGYASRFVFIVLPFAGSAAWPIGLASYLIHAYFYGT